MKKLFYLMVGSLIFLTSCQPEANSGCMDNDALNYNPNATDNNVAECIYRKNILTGNWSVSDTHTGCISGTSTYNCTVSEQSSWEMYRVELSTFANLVPSDPVIMSFDNSSSGNAEIAETHIYIPPSYTEWTVGAWGSINDDNHITLYYYAVRMEGASCSYNGTMTMTKN